MKDHNVHDLSISNIYHMISGVWVYVVSVARLHHKLPQAGQGNLNNDGLLILL